MLIEILPCVNIIKVINPFSRYQSTTFFSIVITFPVSMHSMHVKRKSPCLVQFIRHCYDNSKIVERFSAKFLYMNQNIVFILSKIIVWSQLNIHAYLICFNSLYNSLNQDFFNEWYSSQNQPFIKIMNLWLVAKLCNYLSYCIRLKILFQ